MPLDSSELLDLLRKAVEKVRHATLRADQAEARVQAMARRAEEIMTSVESELDEALTGRFEAERRAEAAEETLARTQSALRGLEERVRGAEATAAAAEARAREGEGRIARALESLSPKAASEDAAPVYVNGHDEAAPMAAVH
jgi:chromosome segregation ATPase